ncbi:hypothetical protein HDZ31DRAFT_62791 [Schizophyllum fasciatum]
MSETTPVTVVAEDAPAQATNMPVGVPTYSPTSGSSSGQPAGRFKRRRMSTNSDAKPVFENKLRGSLAAMTAKTARPDHGGSSAGPATIIAQPAAAKTAPVQAQPQPAMEMNISGASGSREGQRGQQECAHRNRASRIRGGGAGKDCFLGCLGCFLCCECCEGMCDCVADIICCPCEMCC